MGSKRKHVEDTVPLQPDVVQTNEKVHHGEKKHKVTNMKKVGRFAAQKKQEKAVPAAKPTALANSNWMALKSKIQQKDRRHKGSQSLGKKHDLDVSVQKQRVKQEKQAKRMKARTAEWVNNSCIVAMDCEMVGVGLSGKTSVLARCSIVDYEGNVLYDKLVRPVEKVTDFRTHVSGIRSSSLRKAIPFAQCLKEVGKIMQHKIVVGHALKNDFQALMFTPPKHLIRDTAYYRPYMRRKINGTKLYPKSLKHLTEEVLGKQIQTGQHDSVEDARATLELYKREQYAWEKYLRTSKSSSSLVGVAPALPEVDDDISNPLTTVDEAHLDSNNEELSIDRRLMAVPDSKELAMLEYGE